MTTPIEKKVMCSWNNGVGWRKEKDSNFAVREHIMRKPLTDVEHRGDDANS